MCSYSVAELVGGGGGVDSVAIGTDNRSNSFGSP